MRFRHVALLVGPDLRDAEEYYSHLFGMEVVLREGPLEPGGPDADLWGQLPPDRSWEDAESADVAIGMVALQREDVILALFAAQPTGDRTYAVGLVAAPEVVAEIGRRLTDEVVEGQDEGWLAFVDRYGQRWQLSGSAPFRGAGADGRWLEV
jgi:catechol 2,3-dioxygenase-like lactoylglutathione lyase family enzyme